MTTITKQTLVETTISTLEALRQLAGSTYPEIQNFCKTALKNLDTRNILDPPSTAATMAKLGQFKGHSDSTSQQLAETPSKQCLPQQKT